MLAVFFFAASAQTADYEILGFADNDGNQIYSIVLNSTQDLQPRVILKNNGPGVAAVGDTLVFDIYYDDVHYVTSMLVTGSQVQEVTAGEQAIIDLVQPIWTAATMEQYSLIACSICYELRIVGSAHDPNLDNNSACIPFTRELDIDEAAASTLTMFPNPASGAVTLTGADNARVQLFDLSGRRLLDIESATEYQQIDVSALAEGLYIVRISDGIASVTKKLNVIR